MDDAVVIHIGSLFIGSLSLFFISVFIVLPSRSNFHVPTVYGMSTPRGNHIVLDDGYLDSELVALIS